MSNRFCMIRRELRMSNSMGWWTLISYTLFEIKYAQTMFLIHFRHLRKLCSSRCRHSSFMCRHIATKSLIMNKVSTLQHSCVDTHKNSKVTIFKCRHLTYKCQHILIKSSLILKCWHIEFKYRHIRTKSFGVSSVDTSLTSIDTLEQKVYLRTRCQHLKNMCRHFRTECWTFWT